MALVNENSIEYLSKFIKDQSGYFCPWAEATFHDYLRPLLQKYSFKNLKALTQSLKKGQPELAHDVIEAIVHPQTWFYRDIKSFEALRKYVYPTLPSSLRCWVIGCGLGQEAYTLAIDLKEFKTLNALDILATDTLRANVQQAKRGIYSSEQVKQDLPLPLLVKYFKQSHKQWQLHDSIKALVTFQVVNVLNDISTLGKFDLILCRNVLMHFDLATKTKLAQALANALNPQGYLVVSTTETLMSFTSSFEACPGIRGAYKVISDEPLT